MTQRLDTALRAARSAGRVLKEKFNNPRQIRSKGLHDIVTDADYAADKIVREVLLGRWPEDRMLSEEGAAADRHALWQAALASPTLAVWVVDPLDGTTNYAHRHPVFSVSIALYREGQVQIGAVYDPMRNEMFAAERGRGAWLNGRPLKVSNVRTLDQALVGTEWARPKILRQRTAAVLGRLAPRAMSVRAGGSAALSLCSVAAGRLDGYFHFSLSPWDVAAAALVIEEAGGRVTSTDGKPWTVHSVQYVASNGLLHPTLLRILKQPHDS